MNANPVLLQKKYARVIECFAQKAGISLDAALDFFYGSQVYPLLRDGVSDLHCMSDEYLAEDLYLEYQTRKNNAQKGRNGVETAGEEEHDDGNR